MQIATLIIAYIDYRVPELRAYIFAVGCIGISFNNVLRKTQHLCESAWCRARWRSLVLVPFENTHANSRIYSDQ